MTDTAVVTRDEAGRVVAGSAALPGAGRKPGSKNKLTEWRDELSAAVAEHLPARRIKNILSKIAEQAESGHFPSQKLILDKLIPNASPPEEEQQAGAGQKQYVFLIKNATIAATNRERTQEADVIDVTPTQITTEV